MRANLSRVDRAVRVVVGVTLAGAGLFVVRGVPGIVLDAVGAVLVFSGAVGFCHVYSALGICTLARKS